MARETKLVRDEAYEEMGSSYQCVQVAALDSALQEHGVSDAGIRQKICESCLFTMGTFHDEGWLKPSAGAEPVFPLLCFSERFRVLAHQLMRSGEYMRHLRCFRFMNTLWVMLARSTKVIRTPT